MLDQLSAIDSRGIANCLWSYATLQRAAPHRSTRGTSAVQHLAAATVQHLQYMQTQEAISVVWALAVLGLEAPEGLWEGFQNRIMFGRQKLRLGVDQQQQQQHGWEDFAAAAAGAALEGRTVPAQAVDVEELPPPATPAAGTSGGWRTPAAGLEATAAAGNAAAGSEGAAAAPAAAGSEGAAAAGTAGEWGRSAAGLEATAAAAAGLEATAAAAAAGSEGAAAAAVRPKPSSARLDELQPQEIPLVLWCAAQLLVSPSEAWVTYMQQQMQQQLGMMSGKDIALALWSWSVFPGTSGTTTSSSSGGRLNTNQQQQHPEQQQQQHGEQQQQEGKQRHQQHREQQQQEGGLSAAVFDASLTEALWSCLPKVLSELSSLDLSQLLLACVRLNLDPPSGTLQGLLLQQVLRKVPKASLQSVAVTLYALAQLQVELPREWVESFLMGSCPVLKRCISSSNSSSSRDERSSRSTGSSSSVAGWMGLSSSSSSRSRESLMGLYSSRDNLTISSNGSSSSGGLVASSNSTGTKNTTRGAIHGLSMIALSTRRLGISPDRQWQQLYLTAAAEHLRDAKPQELSALVWGISSWEGVGYAIAAVDDAHGRSSSINGGGGGWLGSLQGSNGWIGDRSNGEVGVEGGLSQSSGAGAVAAPLTIDGSSDASTSSSSSSKVGEVVPGGVSGSTTTSSSSSSIPTTTTTTTTSSSSSIPTTTTTSSSSSSIPTTTTTTSSSSSWLQAFEAANITQLDHLTLRDLGLLLSGLGRCIPPSGHKFTEQWSDAILDATSAVLPSAPVRELAGVLVGVARCGLRPTGAWFESYQNALVEVVHCAGSRDVVNVLVACADLGYCPRVGLLKGMLRRLGSCTGACTVLWDRAEVLVEAEQKLQQQQQHYQERTEVMVEVEKQLQLQQQQQLQLLQPAVLQEQQQVLPSSNLQEQAACLVSAGAATGAGKEGEWEGGLADVWWSHAQRSEGARDEGSRAIWNTDWSATKAAAGTPGSQRSSSSSSSSRYNRDSKASSMHAQQRQSGGTGEESPGDGQVSCSDVCVAVWALAKLGVQPGNDWLTGLLEETECLLPTAKGVDLVMIIWGLAKLGHRPTDDWLRAWSKGFEGHMGQLQVESLITGLWGLGEVAKGALSKGAAGEEGFRVEGSFLEAVCRVTEGMMWGWGLEAKQVSALVYMVARLNVGPGMRWLGAAWGALRFRGRALSFEERSKACGALRRMGWRRVPLAWVLQEGGVGGGGGAVVGAGASASRLAAAGERAKAAAVAAAAEALAASAAG